MKTLFRTGIILMAAGWMACQRPEREAFPIRMIDLAEQTATGPYFTYDPMDNPVLCWMEKTAGDSMYRLAFAAYDPSTQQFRSKSVVIGSDGLNPTSESMGKLAFKHDGTIVAVFGKRFINEKNPFAGGIYYTLSGDGGNSWTSPRFLHTDTARHYGRQFFDLARLANGEVGAIWLDGRDTAQHGSTLFFASTSPGNGFDLETVIHRGTCECCRTDLLVDRSGQLHIAYRSLMYPDSRFGTEVRDMAYVHSTDNGRTFSDEQPISADLWAIQACPHTGPSLAIGENWLHATWFTGGGGTGIYYARKNVAHESFEPRILLSKSGSHPQLTTLDGSTAVAVYDEPAHSTGTVSGHNHGQAEHRNHTGAHDHHGKHGSHQGYTDHRRSDSEQPSDQAIAIRVQRLVDGQPGPAIALVSEGINHHPVIARAGRQVIVAWVQETGRRSQIVYTVFDAAVDRL